VRQLLTSGVLCSEDARKLMKKAPHITREAPSPFTTVVSLLLLKP
jgi:hypothetical protein